MKYAFLIYGAEADAPEPTEEQMGKWWGFEGSTVEAGIKQGGEALHPVETAKTVRVRSGQPQVTDGPFAETREQLGGFYILDVPYLDAAIDWAKRFPNLEYGGSVEIRPVIDFSAEQ